MRLMSLFLLFLLSLLPVSAQTLPDGRNLLEREPQAFQSLVSYSYTEETTMQATFFGVGVTVPVMKVEVQALNPGKLRIQTKLAADIDSLLIFDGDKTWTYTPGRNQYSKVPGNAPVLEALDSQLTGDPSQILANAVTRRSERKDVDGMPRECWVVESHLAKGSLDGMQIQDAVYVTWIDKETGIALQRSVSGKMLDGPGEGSTMETKSVKRALKLNERLQASLFVFVPPADAREVDPGKEDIAAAPLPPKPGEPQAYVPFLSPIHREEPDWPQAAKDKGIQGTVQVLITLNTQGLVSAAEALTGPEILRQPAIDAVKRWTFQPVLRGGRPVSAYTETSVDLMDFSKPIRQVDLDTNQEIAAQQRIQQIQSRFPRTPEQTLADLEQDATGRAGMERDFLLPQLAKAAVTAGAFDKADVYADELLASAGDGWNAGTAIHDGNIVRGLVALRRGNVQLAARDLIEAGKTTGGPVLNSFGPNFTLASELLEKGERDAVVEYLRSCKSFWAMGSSRLDTWINTIQAGGKPDFGPNLIY
ncbi:MAG TPA: TonB family protein [Terriglobia bacterium]|jgi:TonB family protein